jgi:hypothetical protein
MPWTVIAIWIAFTAIVAVVNSYRWVVRAPELYWLGATLFTMGGIVAVAYQHGIVAMVARPPYLPDCF